MFILKISIVSSLLTLLLLLITLITLIGLLLLIITALILQIIIRTMSRKEDITPKTTIMFPAIFTSQSQTMSQINKEIEGSLFVESSLILPSITQEEDSHCKYCKTKGHTVKQCVNKTLLNTIKLVDEKWRESLIMNDFAHFKNAIDSTSATTLYAFMSIKNLPVKDSYEVNKQSLLNIYQKKLNAEESRNFNHNIDDILYNLRKRLGHQLYWCVRGQSIHLFKNIEEISEIYDNYVAKILLDIYKNKKPYNGTLSEKDEKEIKAGIRDSFSGTTPIVMERMWNITTLSEKQYKDNHAEAKAHAETEEVHECQICYDETTKIATTQCNHKYCFVCVSTYLGKKYIHDNTNNFIGCPYCRGKIESMKLKTDDDYVEFFEEVIQKNRK